MNNMEELNRQYKESCMRELRKDVIEKLDTLLGSDKITDYKKELACSVIMGTMSLLLSEN